MPAVSQAQNAFMAMSKSPRGRAKLRSSGRKPAPSSVVNEFLASMKGHSVKSLPKHARKK